jgi:hypothetical protein
MSSNSALERTINKVLSQKETELVSQIDSAFQESLKNLEASRGKLESERARITESAKKQAENLKRQIVGSSRLAARNRELVMIENDVNKAFGRGLQTRPRTRATAPFLQGWSRRACRPWALTRSSSSATETTPSR